MESLFAGSSDQSISSILEEDDENHYRNSVLAASSNESPEQLVDKDLFNLMSLIKRLPQPSQDEIEKKHVSFGEHTRHKTLIWDLDETLIHA
jgi:hypothetical protein